MPITNATQEFILMSVGTVAALDIHATGDELIIASLRAELERVTAERDLARAELVACQAQLRKAEALTVF